jgi:hypothetical protein
MQDDRTWSCKNMIKATKTPLFVHNADDVDINNRPQSVCFIVNMMTMDDDRSVRTIREFIHKIN